MDPDIASLTQSLPTLHRLAFSYAPSPARRPTLALLALDARLAGIVRSASEPMLAQLRLAWWRDLLGRDAAGWPQAEPLLAALHSWRGKHRELVPLVDGWEELCGEAPLPEQAFLTFARGRASAFVGLGCLVAPQVDADRIAKVARAWALADLSQGVSDPQERETLDRIRTREAAAMDRLPRTLRPLAVLQGVTARDGHGAGRLLRAMRIGLLGR